MIACLGWGILLIILFAFMCCIMPWWMVLLLFGGMFIYNFFLCGDAPFKIQSRPYKPKKRKNKIEQQKKSEAENNKTTSKARVNNNYTRTTAIGGAALTPHQNDIDYNQLRAMKEEQAAYDDFIASLDMND